MNTDAQYKWMIGTPERWLGVGERMIASASVLWIAKIEPVLGPDKKLTNWDVEEALAHKRGFYLLAGFGVENLFKALRIARMFLDDEATTTVRKGECTLVNELKTHSLGAIASKLALPLSSGQTRLMKKLEACIDWEARYPASVKPLAGRWMRELISTEHGDLLGIRDLCRRAWSEIAIEVSRKRPAHYRLEFDPWLRGRLSERSRSRRD